MEYVYSLDESAFYDYESIIETAKEDYEIGTEVTIYKGEPVEFNHSDFIDIEHIIDSIKERAFEECDEYADLYLNDLCKDSKKVLKEIIAEWLNKNTKKPNFYTVKNVVEIKVTI